MAAIRQIIANAREKHDAAYNTWEQRFKDKNLKANEEDIANGYARFLTQLTNEAASNQATADNSYARTVAPPPVLILPGETTDGAFQRYLNSIRNPQVRHRVELFGRELQRLMNLHSEDQAPDFIIIEMAQRKYCATWDMRRLLTTSKNSFSRKKLAGAVPSHSKPFAKAIFPD
jgi:hypothetical protein